jgi:flagellar biosynthetic protein FlhB
MAEKTEAPTPRRLAEARGHGQVAKSTELTSALVLLAAVWLLSGQGAQMSATLTALMRRAFTRLPEASPALGGQEWTVGTMGAAALGLLWELGTAVGPFLLALLAVGVIANVAQVGLLFTTTTLQPSLARLNPLAGLRRFFSANGLVELGKALAKLALIGLVIYVSLQGEAGRLLALGQMALPEAVGTLARLLSDLALRAAATYLFLGIADYLYQRRRFMQSMRMTRQEVIDDLKRSEGDPFLRGRIRQKQRQLARLRMMQAVPTADVVITNPTHLAVALRYDPLAMNAPQVVAKGAHEIAERIVEIAREHQVPVIQNIPLAQALYTLVEIGQEIPAELYVAVAEVLAFVFNLRRERKIGRRWHPAEAP